MGLNLGDFGAAGDGSYADDALDAALAAAAALAARDQALGEAGQRAAIPIFIPQGTYRFAAAPSAPATSAYSAVCSGSLRRYPAGSSALPQPLSRSNTISSRPATSVKPRGS